MKKKDLKSLKRVDLLELYLQEREENDQLRSEIEQLRQKLEDTSVNKERYGSLAEAALGMAGVFEACDRACRIYRENYMAGVSATYNVMNDVNGGDFSAVPSGAYAPSGEDALKAQPAENDQTSAGEAGDEVQEPSFEYTPTPIWTAREAAKAGVSEKTRRFIEEIERAAYGAKK